MSQVAASARLGRGGLDLRAVVIGSIFLCLVVAWAVGYTQRHRLRVYRHWALPFCREKGDGDESGLVKVGEFDFDSIGELCATGGDFAIGGDIAILA